MIKGLLFDLNGTLIDICTNEEDFHTYRVTANFLDYYGVKITPEQLKDKFFALNHRQRKESKEKFPEFDVSKIFYEIIENYSASLSKTEKERQERLSLADIASRVFRAASRHHLALYDGVKDILDIFKNKYKMGAVSDGQKLWAEPELAGCSLEEYFSFVLVSGFLGYRKPDKRMFEMAIEKMGLPPEEILFIGNDMYRDVYGAKNAGLKCVFFKSNQGDHSFHGVEPDYIIYHFRELVNAVNFINLQEEKKNG
ncbi:MAG: HAD family hydrolase [Lentisphaeria bacterium]|nr:HAD family hydrolase [Lentisphaeria bacterium]